MPSSAAAPARAPVSSNALLEEVQDRVLWLAVRMVHHANKVRENPDGVKVGGHQTSSASVVTILTWLYFERLRPGDLLSVKPHASPAFHAIQYLLGNLDPKYLTTLREYKGLQAYPSRTKDPDPVDFSTGSVGLGSIAPNFAALADAYLSTHAAEGAARGEGPGRRFLSLLGDAELDEGSVWEAIAEPALGGLSNILWIVDLNRQSLDRVIPGIRVRCWREMFAANGWRVVDAKYGKRLQAAFEEPNGEILRNCIDELSNEAYQCLLRLPPEDLPGWLVRKSRHPDDLKRLVSRWEPREFQRLFWNLGGHDFDELREAFEKAERRSGPAVIFAYTLKGWKLPSVGHPQNHSVLLSDEQMESLRRSLNVPEGSPWAAFDPRSPAGRFCAEAARRLGGARRREAPPPDLPIPSSLDLVHEGSRSTQTTFGLFLTSLAREQPDLARRLLTTSPDVASSTNLGGWINKVGVFSRAEREELPPERERHILTWVESPGGQHMELGISENNLFMALGQFGLAWEMFGEMIFPIGTLYDPFVCRGLDAFLYSVYAGARFIVVGTPSGVTLSREGGAHQSVLTASIGAEFPDVDLYEPCFGKELEWILLAALENVRRRARSTYLRLTTKAVDQGRFRLPEGPAERERLRQAVLAGAWRIVDRSGAAGYRLGENSVHLFASGAMVPEALAAGEILEKEGIFANVVSVTGPGPLYRRFHAAASGEPPRGPEGGDVFASIVPPGERRGPVITVVDGHPHALAWIGGALGLPVFPLGVTGFGQSGGRGDIYRRYGIDAEAIARTARKALSPSPPET